VDLGIIIQIVMGIITIVSAFIIVKQKVSQHDETFKTMHQELKESFKKRDDEAKDEYQKLDKKIDVCFCKFDEAKKDLTNFEKALDKKVTLKEVTDEFITRKELDLRLQLIETTTNTIKSEVSKVEKQSEQIISILQDIKSNKKDY